MIPQFARFYGYTMGDILNEYAIVFFSLVNSMFEIKAKEMLDGITVASAVNSEQGGDIVKSLERQAKGIGALVEEVKVVKDIHG